MQLKLYFLLQFFQFYQSQVMSNFVSSMNVAHTNLDRRLEHVYLVIKVCLTILFIFLAATMIFLIHVYRKVKLYLVQPAPSAPAMDLQQRRIIT